MLINKCIRNSPNEATSDTLRIMYERRVPKVSPERKHSFNAKEEDLHND